MLMDMFSQVVLLDAHRISCMRDTSQKHLMAGYCCWLLSELRDNGAGSAPGLTGAVGLAARGAEKGR